MNKKQLLGIALGIVVLIFSFFIPVPDGLSESGMRTIGLLIFFLILLILETLPVGIICLLCLALLPTLGITENLKTGLTGFTNTISYFILASFGVAEAVTSVPLVRRLLTWIMKSFGKSGEMMILSIMVACALCSSIITDVPTTAIFTGIGLSYLKIFKTDSERKQTGRVLMIAIPVSVMLGGLMTPAGSGINILTIGILNELTGVQITFLQWMVAGVPIVLIMIPLSWIILMKVFPPAKINALEIRDFVKTVEVEEKIGKKEKYVIGITIGMLIFWFLSSFFSFIDVTVVALFGCVIFFLPGVEVLSWNQYVKAVSWQAFLLIGTVLCIANAIVANGVSAWFVSYVLPSSISLSTTSGVFFISLIVFCTMLIVPVAPALIAVLSPAVISLSAATNIDPTLLLITLGLCAGNCYLFPLDTIPLITYSTGYYKMTEMPKATIWMQMAFVILVTIWIPIAGKFFNLN